MLSHLLQTRISMTLSVLLAAWTCCWRCSMAAITSQLRLTVQDWTCTTSNPNRWDGQTDRRSDTRPCSAQLWLPGSVPDGVNADRSLEVVGLKFHLCSLNIRRQLCVLELWVVVIKEVKFKTKKIVSSVELYNQIMSYNSTYARGLQKGLVLTEWKYDQNKRSFVIIIMVD